jgi:dTDP-4-dehydrorhamnose reductase
VSVQRPVIDLLNQSTFKEISGYKSAVICAAVTDMATCEEKPDETRAVNVTGTIKLIKKLEEKENHIVFLSTNQLLNSAKKMIPSSFTLLILLKTFTSIVPDEVINFFQSHITS